MPALSGAELRADIRYLAAIDTRHGFLVTATEGWFDRRAHTILTVRDAAGVPLVGVMLRYPFECPEDKTATMWIQYWLADPERKPDLPAAFKRNIQAIYDEMVRVGATRVWGLVPKNAPWFATLLDPIAAEGKCTKVDGASVDESYERGNFFFGNGGEVNTEVQGTV